MLIKHSAALIVLTIIVLIGHEIIHVGLDLWMDVQTWFAHFLSNIFSSNGIGRWIKQVLTFLAVPLVFTFFPAAIYWCFRRHTMPHIKEIFWSLWVIQTVIFCINDAFLENILT